MDFELLSQTKISETEREIRQIQRAAAARAKDRRRASAAERQPRPGPAMPLRLLRALRLAL